MKTKQIEKIEKKIEDEIVKEEKGIKKLFKNPVVRTIAVIFILELIIGAVLYLQIQNSRIYIERAQIDAPIISLTPLTPGVLDRVLVRTGDKVFDSMIVAEVSNQPIRAQTNGIITSVQNTPGQVVSSQTPIVKMIDPREFRVVGRIQEDKGLKDIKPGQKVVFTIDAFSSKEYQGIVDSISPTSHQSDIVFSISDKRAEQDFDVKVKFDVNAYPELKNGMSARMWIYK